MPSLNSVLNSVFGSSNDRKLKKFNSQVVAINQLEADFEKLTDKDLKNKTLEFKARISSGESLDNILVEAFAVVREAGKRTLGQRHFDVQLLGGLVLNQGNISEMKTGEGKTLVATLPVYLNALEEKGVHVVTVNDYLAKRDSEWMGQIYNFLGMTVGTITSDLDEEEKRKSYQADITYGTNNEFGFDYLRDNMKYNMDQLVQRGHNFAIVDEVDSILVDEARTPLIISGQVEDKSQLYNKIDKIIPKISANHIDIDEKSKNVTLTDEGNEFLDELLVKEKLMDIDSSIYDMENVSLVHHVNQALKAHKIFNKDTDYLVKDNQVIIIDEFTGRMMEGRRFSDGLHQALEAKEKVMIQPENRTMASITFQNYFRLYKKLSGMTGTASTESEEFLDIYNLDVISIPPNIKITRKDHDDEIYRTAEEKYNAIIESIIESNKKGQPVLVGTTSIERSEYLSKLLKNKKIDHNVLNAKYHQQEAEIIAQAGSYGKVTIATNMAGRGTDIQLGGADNPEDGKTKTINAGGLYVIGTERHESRRIDNQLRGRSGRQGDAGESKFYLSLEDDLMRIFGSDRLDLILKKLGLEEGESIVHPWINTALERAQKKVESRNFEIRKTLLKFDNVMNDQRKVIFEQRLDLLKEENVNETIHEMRLEVVSEILNKAIPENSFIDDWDSELIEKEVKRIFNLKAPIKNWLKDTEIDSEQLEAKLNEYFDEEYLKKRKGFGEQISDSIEKSILMQIIDQNWTDHLGQLEDLRQIVGIRGYGQRDPLNEYKSESFLLFENLLNKFREDVTRTLFHIRMVSDEAIEKLNENNNQIETHHNKDENISKNKTVINKAKNIEIDPNNPSTWGKVGRNELCPCGSGKKYKNCHGKN
ncbi:MAG: preprotein translocase subunit SecA [Rickettsiales bacterium TMED269]|nr:preprotein translocase subunit SecA [Rhodobiaceae bacterium]OUX41048.1 MAG: preprotein translocase subunit SecA [Rickettsiales bacterium TMED269]|tara:strand:- start:696 stop:3317 length:2622 start_codon:yes stop_codon:yes gene_type:complete